MAAVADRVGMKASYPVAGAYPPSSVFDFVQGITAVSRDKTHQEAQLTWKPAPRRSSIGPYRCLIPEFDGATLPSSWRDALWAKFSTGAQTHDELRTHLGDFVNAYNFARRLKTLKGLTAYEYV